ILEPAVARRMLESSPAPPPDRGPAGGYTRRVGTNRRGRVVRVPIWLGSHPHGRLAAPCSSGWWRRCDRGLADPRADLNIDLRTSQDFGVSYPPCSATDGGRSTLWAMPRFRMRLVVVVVTLQTGRVGFESPRRVTFLRNSVRIARFNMAIA